MPRFHSVLRVPGGGRAAPNRHIRRALLRSSIVAVALASAVAAAAPAEAAPTITLGAVGDVAGLSQETGSHLAVHTYGSFTRGVPANADMITVRYPGVTWRQVASAAPGSAIYGNIARWAKTIKSRPGTVMLAYHHEPEARASRSYGTSADFVAAYRKVESIFDAQGASNVNWTWQMTDYAFRVSSSDLRYAPDWYPGDAYVDTVGADGYNWSNCYGHNGTWQSMASFTDPVIAFAKAHGKRAALPEFGAAPDSRRAQWLHDAHQYLVANRNVMSAVFYFQLSSRSGCSWRLTTQPEFHELGAMAHDADFTTG